MEDGLNGVSLTVLAVDELGNSLTTGDVYIDGKLVGFTGLMFDVGQGNHQVKVNDFWEQGTGNRYGFQHWEDGSTSPTRTVDVPEAVTATFKKKWCPGDVDGDTFVTIGDVSFAASLFGAYPGHAEWDSRCDVDSDHFISANDVSYVAMFFGEMYQDP